MPAKFLDLDVVRKPIGEFTLAGITYPVWPLTIAQIINLSAEPDPGATVSQQDQLHRLVQGLKEAIPECPEEALLAMDMVQFNALSAWIQRNGEPEEKNDPPPPATAPLAYQEQTAA